MMSAESLQSSRELLFPSTSDEDRMTDALNLLHVASEKPKSPRVRRKSELLVQTQQLSIIVDPANEEEENDNEPKEKAVDNKDGLKTTNIVRQASFRTLRKRKIHHLYVKVPAKGTRKLESMVGHSRKPEQEEQVYSELLSDLQKFVKERVGDAVPLFIPDLKSGADELAKQGFSFRDWFVHKLNHNEVVLAVTQLARFHASGLAFRMSLKEELQDLYPYLNADLYTSNLTKELLAKYLDSFLHFLSQLPGVQRHVLKLRQISHEVFRLLVKLRRPRDMLGTRFSTICHGDMWMGNLMFRNESECVITDFRSAQFLSPATDLAHLLLTSTTREYRQGHWDEVVQCYYDVFNRSLAEFGLVLRHLGTSYNDFLQEVRRAVRGQFLCVALVIPIVIYCGPSEWKSERRRGLSMDRKNTIRHLIQMMSITEEKHVATAPAALNSHEEVSAIPDEFVELYQDKEFTQTLMDLFHTADDLDLLDFRDVCKHINTPKPAWSKTQATTGKHIPVY